MKPALTLLVGAALCLNSLAQTPNFTDDFEAGLGGWTTTGNPTFSLSTYTNQVPESGVNSALYPVSGALMYANQPDGLGITDRYDSCRFSVWIFDWNTNNNLRNFATIRSYGGGSYGSGTLNQLIAIGTYNTADAALGAYVASNYSGRVAFGSPAGWFSLTNAPARTAGWHLFQIERGTNAAGQAVIKWFVDGVLGRALTNTGAAALNPLNAITAGLGAGSTAGSAYYDGFEVVTGQAFMGDEPRSMTNLIGTVATFEAGAYGSASPLTYQWSRNGEALTDGGNVAGATTPSLVINNVQLADAGWYSVIVSNFWGARTNAFPAWLEVTPIVITTQPTNLVVNLGSNNVSFYCEATGAGTLNYQWQRDGTPITGATDPTYTIPVVGPGDIAFNPGYACVVSTTAGSVASGAATLRSNAPPVIAPLNITTNLGSPVVIIVPVTDDYSSLGIIHNFEGRAVGSTTLFQHPAYSGSTSPTYVAAPGSSAYVTNANIPPGLYLGTNALFVTMNFTNESVPGWDRLSTANFNPIVSFTGPLKFSIWTDRPMGVAAGFRETNPTGDIGQNGGASGPIEFVGVTQGGSIPVPGFATTAGVWTNFQFDVADPDWAYNYIFGSSLVAGSDGILNSPTDKGVLECLALTPTDGLGVYRLYLDNFQSIPMNGLSLSLESGPQDALFDAYAGVIRWTVPVQPGTQDFTVVVTDHLGLSTTNTLTVTGAVPAPVREPLQYRLDAGQLVLTWTNSAFSLESATAVGGSFSKIQGATSPYTNDVAGEPKYFRLVWP